MSTTYDRNSYTNLMHGDRLRQALLVAADAAPASDVQLAMGLSETSANPIWKKFLLSSLAHFPAEYEVLCGNGAPFDWRWLHVDPEPVSLDPAEQGYFWSGGDGLKFAPDYWPASGRGTLTRQSSSLGTLAVDDTSAIIPVTLSQSDLLIAWPEPYWTGRAAIKLVNTAVWTDGLPLTFRFEQQLVVPTGVVVQKVEKVPRFNDFLRNASLISAYAGATAVREKMALITLALCTQNMPE